MANGIDWFRWHHGSVTDPKFALIAKKSGARLGDVLAVWAYVLERASASDERGTFGEIDCEAVDCMLGMDDGQCASIYAAMSGRGLVGDGKVCAWEKRQPKREREDDNSTARVQAFRERQRQQATCNTAERHETPVKRQETPREEKRREEEIRSVPIGTGAEAPPSPVDVIFGFGIPILTAAGVSDKNARSMLGLMRKTHGESAVVEAIRRCSTERPLEPVAWLQAVLKAKPAMNKREAIEDDNRRLADQFLARTQ